MQLYLIDGNTQKLDGGAMFGNAPKALWQRWVSCDAENRIDMACRCLLMVTDSGKNILFEAGIGLFFSPLLRERYGVQESEHRLLQSLAQLGLSHADIDTVVLSHLHFDHAGGLLSAWEEGKAPELLFPNATFIVSKQHWQHANAPHFRDKASFIPALNQLLLHSQRLCLVDSDNQDSVLSHVRFHFSDGHTPSLLLSEITTPTGPLLFASDLIPGQHWVHLPICMGYDRFPEKLIDEKHTLLTYLLEQQGRIYFTHDADMACGSVQRDAQGRFSVIKAALQ